MAFGRSFAVLVGLLGMIGPAIAQSGAPAEPPVTDASRRSGTLSDKLDATDGVIHPQGGIDGGMQKAPAVDSRMPVIPPAGAAGGGQDGVAK